MKVEPPRPQSGFLSALMENVKINVKASIRLCSLGFFSIMMRDVDTFLFFIAFVYSPSRSICCV